MSFTTDVKNEMTRVPSTCSHCDAAVLSGLMRTEGSLFFSGKGRYRVEMSTDIPAVARLTIRLLHGLYKLRTELTVRRSVLHKTPNYLITVPGQPHMEETLRTLGIVDEKGFVAGIAPHLVNKRCDQAAYLRGIFMGAGFVADPKGDFHFEMTIENEQLANDIAELMRSNGINARIMNRRNSFLVYLKSGSAITSFLALTEAHQSVLTMENERVIKSLRNDVNRQVNAEIANQAKSSEAAVEQVVAIRKVLGRYAMDDLPPALREYISLRIAYPGASLKELGAHADPPLSKSAIYHRVRRIEQMAQDIDAGTG
ncbi:MAG: DNA-binding protein WhiA [Eggerthellaceae bacterium]|jgi:DNA-binding protein WhiA